MDDHSTVKGPNALKESLIIFVTVVSVVHASAMMSLGGGMASERDQNEGIATLTDETDRIPGALKDYHTPSTSVESIRQSQNNGLVHFVLRRND